MCSPTEFVEVPKPLTEHRGERRRLGLGAALILVLAFAVYWPALRGQFVWDDLLVVHRNPLVTGELGLGSIWFRTDFPLSNIAFWAQWRLWGDNPAGYHVVNVLLHAASAVLLWRVLARLKIRAGWLAAVIFAVHPVCVASVAWISELKNTLSLFFYLLSILWYSRFTSGLRTSDFGLRTSKWYCLSLGAFVLALFSKTSTVMLPVVLLGFAWWQHGRLSPREVLRTGPFFALALAFGLMSVWFQAHGAMAGVAVQSENLWGRLAGAGMALWFYLGKALAPLHLTMIYPRWKIEAATPGSYLPLLLWLGVLAVCWGFRRSWGRHALFGLGCFTVTLFPALGFFDMYFLALSRVSDHFAYLPLTALVALGAAGLSCALRGRALGLAGGGLVAGLAALAMLRAQVFVNEETLWRDTLAKNPAAWCAHANLGWILAEQQKYDEAREHLAASLQFHPNNAQAHCNLGRVLSLQGKFTEAEGHFLTALKIKPKDAEIRKSYASALAEHGRKEEAVNQLREALRLQPEIEPRVQLATLLCETGHFREAVDQYRQALAVEPDLPEALSNQAWLLAACSDDTVREGKEAVQLAERACRLTDYKQAPMVGVLAAAYAEAGRFPDAVATAQKAIELATAASDQRFAAMNQQLLRLYRAGKPYHEPVR
jgi:Flp pilus assembly protein TadD